MRHDRPGHHHPASGLAEGTDSQPFPTFMSLSEWVPPAGQQPPLALPRGSAEVGLSPVQNLDCLAERM